MVDTDELLRPAAARALPAEASLDEPLGSDDETRRTEAAFPRSLEDDSRYATQAMNRFGASTWVVAGVAAVVAVAVIAVVGILWSGLDDSGMTAGGWIAMVFGALATLALGMGLMALVFISNRRGYDDPSEPLP